MRNVVGICNLHDCPHLGRLTMHRPTGATTFLGRYGLMDFTLSNFSNSGIDRVAVLAESDVHSVRNHLQNGQVWINNTKLGFHRILTNENLLGVSKFNTDINNLIANKNIFYKEDPDYIIFAPAFMLMSYDYNELLEAHKASGADITVLCKHIENNLDKDFLNCDTVVVDPKTGIINDFATNTCRKKEVDISLESFIFSKNALVELVKESQNVSSLYSLRRMIIHFARNKLCKVSSCFFDGYVVPILDFEHYIHHSFNLLKFEERCKLFKENWPIYTTTHNTPPALYGEHAIVSNSFIANGCVIRGKVKNSIISRDVVVEEGAVIEDSIIFTKSEIGSNVKVRCVVADKYAQLRELKKVSGEKDAYLYIATGEKV